MFAEIAEKRVHLFRWLLAISWLLLIFSLFYDPISPILTSPDNLSSPLRIHPEDCVSVQDKCLLQEPYAIAARIFWGAVVPAAIFMVFVFGHEAWRRLCPLSFFSQIPRSLKIQRIRQVIDPITNIVSDELVNIDENSWLGRNHLYFQFALLFFGLTARLLMINSHRVALGIVLLLTIISAVTVGYLYAGKSWCNYFCPFSPVQAVFTGPRGLLGSQANQKTQPSITQSMCRTVEPKGEEKSACVACKSPCIDIDAENTYWQELNKPGRKFVQYGYVGLLIGFFGYFYLYAGNWNYYFSGIWSRDDSWEALGKSGLYFLTGEHYLPKWLVVPLVLASCTGLSYWILSKFEKAYKANQMRQGREITQLQVRHIIFSGCTLFSFWFFFTFAGRPLINTLPEWVRLSFNGVIVGSGVLWFSQTLKRTQEQYQQEGLAYQLRPQLAKLPLDFERILGRSLNDLEPNIVYILPKLLAEVTKQDRLKVYKEVAREHLEAGNSVSESQLFLKKLSQSLGITDEEKEQILAVLKRQIPPLEKPRTTRVTTEVNRDRGKTKTKPIHRP